MTRRNIKITFAGIGLSTARWCPRQVVVELGASLTVQTHRVVGTVALTVYLHGKKINSKQVLAS
jgi:hypothetical protein